MKKKLAAVVLSMVLCLGMSMTALAANSPSANNSSTTTTTQSSTPAPAKAEVKVEQKALTQDTANAVQKEKLNTYFNEMSTIDSDATLTVEQKTEKKVAAVQTLINKALGLNYTYKQQQIFQHQLQFPLQGSKLVTLL